MSSFCHGFVLRKLIKTASKEVNIKYHTDYFEKKAKNNSFQLACNKK